MSAAMDLPVSFDPAPNGSPWTRMLLQALDERLDPVFAVLPSGRLAYVNRTACLHMGGTREELLGRAVWEVDSGASPETWAAFWENVKHSGTASRVVMEAAHLGASVPVEVTGTYMSLEGQELMLGNIRDLAPSEALFRDLLEHQGEGFATTDAEDRFVYANPVAEEIFGTGPGGLEGRRLLDFLEPGESARMTRESALRRGGTRSTGHFRICRPGGDLRTVQVTTTPKLDAGGRFSGTIGVFRDITDDLASEESLRQSLKLESLGLLAGGIAHDFNNLLTAIIGNLNLAQGLLEPADPAAPYLEKVERTVLRAADLTRQLLAYSGRGQFQVMPLDLNQVVREIAQLMKVSIPKTISLRFHLLGDLPPVEADAAQVQQVVMNLMTNAAEAIGPEGGFIIVGTRTVDLEETPAPMFLPGPETRPGRYVVLDVTDTGCGMAPDVQERIFDPFYTTKPAGRGLGLSAMMGILRGHGAGIKIRSSPGRGSTFEIFFPACAGELPPPSPWDAPSASVFTGRVLLVDDEAVVLEATGAALESLGFEVVLAQDGVQALEKFEAEGDALRLVLMDVTMPRMDGRAAFKAMHASRPGIPVILSSGYDRQVSTEGFAQMGLAGFLQKPYRIPELRRALAQALESWT